jgi:2-polyprenyl-3-methyl-5-hydroxy-6-metoxy-1,4-benzoquinol methylase
MFWWLTMQVPHDSRRTPTEKELCHERLGARFASALSDYDTQRRVDVLVDQFLTDEMLKGKRILDVGCGLGFFSERLAERGANVLACDLGPGLVESTRRRVGCEATVADALELVDHFGAGHFDGVVSSECIEHTPDPLRAVSQMLQVTQPGGFLAISTPNIVWYPVVRMATLLKARPFDGHENFSSWSSLRRTIQSSDGEVIREQGLHLFPFQLRLHEFSTWCDRNLQAMRMAMINLCLLARRRGPEGR